MAFVTDFNIDSVKGKVFLVTGGAAGVGAGVVGTLLQENATHVAFLDNAEREGEALERALISKFGGLKAKFIKCDISDEAQLEAAYKQVVGKYSRLDGVVNNAAIIGAEDGSYKRVIDVNFAATVSSTLRAIDVMSVANGGYGGVVINLSSLLALKPSSHLPVYAATKTAVLAFSNSIGAPEFVSKTQVRVVTVCLGPTDTAILHKPIPINADPNRQEVREFAFKVTERQRVESAVTGIVNVMSAGSGTTWVIANDNPPLDITKNIRKGFEVFAEEGGYSFDKIF